MNKRSCSTFCYIKQSPEDKEKGMETGRNTFFFFHENKKTQKTKLPLTGSELRNVSNSLRFPNVYWGGDYEQERNS